MKGIDPNGKNTLLIVGGAVVTVAVLSAVSIHTFRMMTDTQYRQSVVEGAQRAIDATTVGVSVSLSKTVKRDKNDREYDITGPLPTKENKGGGRGRFQTYQDAIDQANEITDRQVKIWKGKAEGIIDSTEKSLGRLTNALGDIVFPADADVEPKEEPKETPEDGKKK